MDGYRLPATENPKENVYPYFQVLPPLKLFKFYSSPILDKYRFGGYVLSSGSAIELEELMGIFMTLASPPSFASYILKLMNIRQPSSMH